MIVPEPIQACILHSLNHFAYSNAIFLAERLYAEVKTDDVLHLLATCNIRAGNISQAHAILEINGYRTPHNRYLMAHCCFQLNKLSDSEITLKGDAFKNLSIEELIGEYGDTASYALELLGKLYAKTERNKEAALVLNRALGLNPFLWSAFETLCQIGEKPNPEKLFQVSNVEDFHMCSGKNPLLQYINNAGAYTAHTLSKSSKDIPVHNQQAYHTPDNIQNISATFGTPPMLAFLRETTNTSGSFIDSKFATPIQTSGCKPVLDCSTPAYPINQVVLPLSVDTNNHLMVTPDNPIVNNQVPTAPKSKSSFKKRSCNLPMMHNLFNNNYSPISPSFGVFPLETINNLYEIPSMSEDSNENKMSQFDNIFNQKSLLKKLTSVRNVSPSKPTVFSSQSGNTGIQQQILSAYAPIVSSSPTVGTLTPVRRSSRLFSSSNSVKENNKISAKPRITSPKPIVRKPKSRLVKQNTMNGNNVLNMSGNMGDSNPESIANKARSHMLSLQKASSNGLMVLLQDLGKAYLHLCQYECKEAVDILSKLPTHHHLTGWVLAIQGRAYFEMSNYDKAIDTFQQLKEAVPYRLEGLEYYSTALWHQQKEVELTALAHDVSDHAPSSAHAWCISGNCFSLQKENEIAVKCFQRAVQVDPAFPYAYTLLGHEYVTIEELDKATACFRSAIRLDSRHYNAWYGLGMIYYKQEKYSFAEIHFRRALDINPQSSVLMCHIGVVQHAQQKTNGALSILNRAIETNPSNPLCKFHRASIYFNCERYEDALDELEELKQLVPKESLVYFLLGKVHKKLGNTDLALMHFSWAMDLDPGSSGKGASSQIKEAIDKHYTGDDESQLRDDQFSSINNNNSIEDEDHEVGVAGAIIVGSANSLLLEAINLTEHSEQVAPPMESEDSF